jgi:hypothetical protein
MCGDRHLGLARLSRHPHKPGVSPQASAAPHYHGHEAVVKAAAHDGPRTRFVQVPCAVAPGTAATRRHLEAVSSCLVESHPVTRHDMCLLTTQKPSVSLINLLSFGQEFRIDHYMFLQQVAANLPILFLQKPAAHPLSSGLILIPFLDAFSLCVSLLRLAKISRCQFHTALRIPQK